MGANKKPDRQTSMPGIQFKASEYLRAHGRSGFAPTNRSLLSSIHLPRHSHRPLAVNATEPLGEESRPGQTEIPARESNRWAIER